MAANEKKTTIVIKKITVAPAGGHGGSWKVAFADFMTSMMAFFLVMWLVNQTPTVKKNVSEYFSTPSIIEYNFQNYGVELTLEKLFLDLINEPLKALQDFITPADHQPNVLDMGMKKIEMRFLEDKVGAYAENVKITDDEVRFDIPATDLFVRNSANPARDFVAIMEPIKGIMQGLKDANVYVNSVIPSGRSNVGPSRNIADARLDLVSDKVQQGIVNEGVNVYGKVSVKDVAEAGWMDRTNGIIQFRIRMKSAPAPARRAVADADSSESNAHTAPAAATVKKRGHVVDDAVDQTYDDFVDKLTKKVEGVDTTR